MTPQGLACLQCLDMVWLRFSTPACLPARQARWARAILAAWLLVLIAGLFTPWVQARGLEAVCSGSGHGSYRLGPDADGLAQVLHGLDCPLCLPQLAAPPTAGHGALADAGHTPPPRLWPAWAWTRVPSACPPPARGPPGG